jgi:hypothetical protein
MDNPDVPKTLGIHDTGRKQKNKQKQRKKTKQTNQNGTQKRKLKR